MATDKAAAAPQVDPTGVANLDAVLGGGVPRGALAIVVGPPGSGKTTLACQIAFATAQRGRRALILTALSEPTNKLLAHLRTFRFFDEKLLGGAVQLMSLEQFLPQGLATTGEELLKLVREARADLVVIDGFRGLRGADTEPQRAREFLYDVGSSLSVRGVTAVVTSEAEPRDPAFFPELTTADVIIGMHYRLAGVRQYRSVEAVKVRGGAPLPGLHALSLSEDGVTVYPRLEVRVAAPARHGDAGTAGQGPEGGSAVHSSDEGRASFGVPGLDGLLDGGLERSTLTLVTGDLGTGKTTLALRFALAGVALDEPTLFVGFRETPEQVARKARVFGADSVLVQALAPRGGLELLYLAPVELDPDSVADQLLAAIDRIGARRLVIDSIVELERTLARSGDPGRVEEYLAALAVLLRRRGVTSLLIREMPRAVLDTRDGPLDPVAMVADNVLLQQQMFTEGRLRRVISVLKTRFAAHDDAMHELVLGPPEGIHLLPIAQSTGREATDASMDDDP